MSEELDEAVALALGWKHPGAIGTREDSGVKGVPWCLSDQNDWWQTPEGEHVCGPCCGYPRPYSTAWEYGGPIIERERIWLTSWPDGTWGADIAGEPGDPSKNLDPKPGEPGHVKATAQGPTPLIAAMRAFVASRKT
jgi:hypothetical protein